MKEIDPFYIIIDPDDLDEESRFQLKLDAIQNSESRVRNTYYGDKLQSERYVFKLVSIVKIGDYRPENIPTKIIEVVDKVKN